MEPTPADSPRPASPHLSEDTLELYALHQLSEADCEQVEAHLLICRACQDLADETLAYVSGMKAALAEPAPPPGVWETLLHHLRHPRPLLAFGLALAALGVAVGISFLRGPGREPVLVTLLSERSGADTAALGPAGAPLLLNLESESLPVSASYEVRIVDAAGRAVWSGPAQSPFRAGPLAAGIYWVRLYDSGQLVREYGLRLE